VCGCVCVLGYRGHAGLRLNSSILLMFVLRPNSSVAGRLVFLLFFTAGIQPPQGKPPRCMQHPVLLIIHFVLCFGGRVLGLWICSCVCVSSEAVEAGRAASNSNVLCLLAML
jgi:hypothetical protein